MFMKKYINLLLIITISFFYVVNYVNAESIFDNNDEAVEKFNYDDAVDEDSTDDVIKENDSDNSSVDVETEHNGSLILVELFCGLIGIIMVFLAFRVN